MFTVVISLVTLLIGAFAGILSLGWLNHRPVRRPVAASDTEPTRISAGAVLAHLLELTNGVALDLDEHQCELDGINEELLALHDPKTRDVVQSVTKLVQVNQRIQAQLDLAEGKLRTQAHQIESHAAEARTDSLTMVANRRAFDDELNRQQAAVRTDNGIFSLLLADVDNFKRLNDEHGHVAGDAALRCMARALRKEVRKCDLIARYGGEEFAFILPKTPIADAKMMAERLRRAIERSSCVFEGTVLDITASFGVAQADPELEASALVKRVDAALYASKNAGRNCGHWHDGTTSHLIDNAQREESLRNRPDSVRSVVSSSPAGRKPATSKADCDVLPATQSPAATCGDATVHSTTGPPIAVRPIAVPPSAEPKIMERTAICADVRRRVAVWRPEVSTFSVALMELPDVPAGTCQNGSGNELGVPTSRDLVMGVAPLILEAVRETDLVARYTSHTLCLLFPDTSLVDAGGVVERLRRKMVEGVGPITDGAPPRSVFAGVAEVTASDDAVALMRRAEEALDVARREGGHVTYQHPGNRQKPVEYVEEGGEW